MKKVKEKSNKKQNKKMEEQKIDLNNEIIIGLTPKKEETKQKTKNKKAKKTVKPTNNKKKQKNKNKKSIKKKNIKFKTRFKIIKWTSLFMLLVLIIILFLRSSVFNIKEIKVENNSIIPSEEIIKLSTLQTENNMFKYSNKAIINSIKTNAYIENVKIKRKFNGTVILDVIERKPTFMLKFGNSYVYINNQGYMLELSETPLELPIIIGFETPSERIKEGNRLIVNDLEKLEDILKIINSARETPIYNLITVIDITDKTNYKLELSSESKLVQFGTATNISVKLLKIQEVLEQEKDIAGEIYFQDSERTVFKENV